MQICFWAFLSCDMAGALRRLELRNLGAGACAHSLAVDATLAVGPFFAQHMLTVYRAIMMSVVL